MVQRPQRLLPGRRGTRSSPRTPASVRCCPPERACSRSSPPWRRLRSAVEVPDSARHGAGSGHRRGVLRSRQGAGQPARPQRDLSAPQPVSLSARPRARSRTRAAMVPALEWVSANWRAASPLVLVPVVHGHRAPRPPPRMSRSGTGPRRRAGSCCHRCSAPPRVSGRQVAQRPVAHPGRAEQQARRLHAAELPPGRTDVLAVGVVVGDLEGVAHGQPLASIRARSIFVLDVRAQADGQLQGLACVTGLASMRRNSTRLLLSSRKSAPSVSHSPNQLVTVVKTSRHVPGRLRPRRCPPQVGPSPTRGRMPGLGRSRCARRS